ncbi:MAG: response regulator [Pirellulaceae bacterium]|nr:response regulator [Pirellulaceae bacterium]
MTATTPKPLVLLVDDDSDFLWQQRVQLEAAGFDVVTAVGESEAKQKLAERHPDLAVIDVMMDNPDTGFTLCYYIRKMAPDVPLILVTSIVSDTGLDFALASDNDRAWIRADAFLAKPIRFEQLRSEIDRLLPGRARTTVAAAAVH